MISEAPLCSNTSKFCVLSELKVVHEHKLLHIFGILRLKAKKERIWC